MGNQEVEKKIMSIVAEDGSIEEVEVILAFEFKDTNKEYDELLDDMINIGIKDYKKRVSKTHSFESNILQGFAANGGAKGMKGVKGKLN